MPRLTPGGSERSAAIDQCFHWSGFSLDDEYNVASRIRISGYLVRLFKQSPDQLKVQGLDAVTVKGSRGREIPAVPRSEEVVIYVGPQPVSSVTSNRTNLVHR